MRHLFTICGGILWLMVAGCGTDSASTDASPKTGDNQKQGETSEENSSPAQKNLDTAIAEAASLIEQKDLRTFYERYVPSPIRLFQSTDAFLYEAGQNPKAVQELAGVLRDFESQKPHMLEDGTKAIFIVRKPTALGDVGEFTFLKEQGRWLMLGFLHENLVTPAKTTENQTTQSSRDN